MSVIDEIMGFDFENRSIEEYLTLCLKCETEEEATLFLEKYRKTEPEFGDKNLGYIFGYCSNEDRKRLYKLFPVVHPIFGSGFGREQAEVKMTKKGKLVKQLVEIDDVIHETGADDLEIVNVATLKKQIYLIAEAVDKLTESEETRVRIAEYLERKEKG